MKRIGRLLVHAIVCAVLLLGVSASVARADDGMNAGALRPGLNADLLPEDPGLPNTLPEDPGLE